MAASDCANTWLADARVRTWARAEMDYLLAVQARALAPPPCMPDTYVQEAEGVLQHLPTVLHTALLRIIMEAELPSNFVTVYQLAAVMRECIGKQLLAGWEEFIGAALEQVPMRTTQFEMPWDNPADCACVQLQVQLAQEAAEAVAASMRQAWTVFQRALMHEPGAPVTWTTPDQLCVVLAKTMPTMPRMSAGRYLLAALLAAMKTHPEDDARAATTAARAVNTSIRAVFQEPDVETPPRLVTTEQAAFARLQQILACEPDALLAALRTHAPDSARRNPVALLNRLLPRLFSLQLPSTVPTEADVVVVAGMRARRAVAQAFQLSVQSPHGVLLAAIMQTGRGPPSMHAVKSVVSRAVAVAFARYPKFYQRWASQLATAVAFLSLGQEAWPWAPDPALAALARHMVVQHGEDTYLTLLPLMEYVVTLPMRQGGAGLGSCPTSCGPRAATDIASKFLAPAPLHWLRRMATVLRRVALDGQTHKDTLFQDGAWATAVSYRQSVDAGAALRDLHVECALGMPTPRMLAARVAYFELATAGPSSARLPEDVAVCALLWHASAGVRHGKVLPAVYGAALAAPPDRKRKRHEVVACLACGCEFAAAADAPFTDGQRGCAHALCLPCAVRAVEGRVADVMAGDGSSEEQTRGCLLKCPVPQCMAALDWALPCVSPEARYMIGKHASMQAVAASTASTKCAACWDVVQAHAAAGVVGMCGTCGQGTCTQCGRLAHPGSVCTARLSGTALAPETILSEAKMQACPAAGCGARTTKDGGCNHMTCPKCGVHWCWVCSQAMELDRVTEHYKAGTCSSHAYTEQLETQRIRGRIEARADVEDGLKLDVMRLLMGTFAQTVSDL